MSEVKVNKISPRSGTTVTLGDSGDTFTIPSGATINNQGTATNFGATGSASWVTTVKTGDFTAVAGEGYFVNTTSGAITVTLPASPSAGAVVAVKDYANTWDSNACTLGRNGSNIGGEASDSILETEGLAVTLVFIDATKGWLVTDSGLQSEARGPAFISATGGNTTATVGNFKIHTFTSPGTFCVSCAGNSAGNNKIEYLVIGGGAGGGFSRGGGGGAGGYRFSPGTTAGCYSAGPSPLGATALTASVAAIPVTVGAGGIAGTGPSIPANPGGPGSNTTFSTIISAGGGGGGGTNKPSPDRTQGETGGSGGGGGIGGSGGGSGGAGNTPPVSPPQGNSGGNSRQTAAATTPNSCRNAGGGGGAGAVGAVATSCIAGPGGAGLASTINNSPVTRGGGGGGGTQEKVPGTGGPGGGGAGGNTSYPSGPIDATSGTVNTGGGGGGGQDNGDGGTGGSGLVIIRYKFQ
jgi:hypothetical protein